MVASTYSLWNVIRKSCSAEIAPGGVLTVTVVGSSSGSALGMVMVVFCVSSTFAKSAIKPYETSLGTISPLAESSARRRRNVSVVSSALSTTNQPCSRMPGWNTPSADPTDSFLGGGGSAGASVASPGTGASGGSGAGSEGGMAAGSLETGVPTGGASTGGSVAAGSPGCAGAAVAGAAGAASGAGCADTGTEESAKSATTTNRARLSMKDP